jgi:beta-phosphoglucomutase-like phosphatase (HAD superfamily)
MGKPDPEMYIKMIEQLSVCPCEVVVVEDNENGVIAATLAGAHVLRVSNPSEVNIDKVLSFIEELEVQNCSH